MKPHKIFSLLLLFYLLGLQAVAVCGHLHHQHSEILSGCCSYETGSESEICAGCDAAFHQPTIHFTEVFFVKPIYVAPNRCSTFWLPGRKGILVSNSISGRAPPTRVLV